MAWVNVCKPIPLGGLGLPDLEKFSRALRLRWLWYAWDQTPRTWKGMDLPIDDDDLALFRAATVVTIGDGNTASFWNSSWLDGQAPATLFPALFKHSKRKNRTVKDALTGNRWITDVDYNLSELLIAEFVLLWGRLEGFQLNQLQEDKITWAHTSDGCYTARSAYELQFMGSIASATAQVTWRTKAPPKCRFFVWLMVKNRIWTAARLQLREWPNDYFCQLCWRNLETTSHLFQDCCFTKLIWEKVSNWISATAMSPANWIQTSDFEQWYMQIGECTDGNRRAGNRAIAMLTVWEVWKERNARIFNKTSRSPQQVFYSIQEEARTWVRAGNRAIEPCLVESNVNVN